MSYAGYFAAYYDRLNSECDYEAIADYYEQVFQRFQVQPELVLDLGCGSGNITLPMAQRGYDMIGLDISQEMLQLAMEKAAAAGRQDILFLDQDMTDFELYGTVDAAICALDGLNYLTDKRQLMWCLRLTSFYMNPQGLFIFDVNTPYKFEQVLSGSTFVYDLDEVYCVWQNRYDKKSRLCEFDITLFAQEGQGWQKYHECQQERCYALEEWKSMLERAGFRLEGMYHDRSFHKPGAKSERVYFVARKVTEAGTWK